MVFERGFCDAIIVDTVPLSALILPVVINGTPERIGSLTSDGVNQSTSEIALSDIVRRDLDLYLVDGVQRDGLGVGLAAEGAGETEGVVEVGSVHGNVVHAGVGAGKAKTAGRWFQPGKILERPTDRRQLVDLSAADQLLSARVGIVKYVVLAGGGNHGGLELFRFRDQREVAGVVLAENERDILLCFCFEADIGNG